MRRASVVYLQNILGLKTFLFYRKGFLRQASTLLSINADGKLC